MEDCVHKDKIVSVNRQDGVTVVTFNVASISSPASVDKISEQLKPMVAMRAKESIIVDFDGVRFFSSLVLGMLVDLWRRLKEQGGALVISGINPQLSRVFRITNLDTIFKFYPDRDSAIKGINATDL